MKYRKPLVLIAGGCATLACLGMLTLGALFGVNSWNTGGAASVSEAFMTALINGNPGGAFALCAPDLQAELGGSPAAFQAKLAADGTEPTAFALTSRTSTLRGATISGSATLRNGRPGAFTIMLEGSASDWLITSFEIRDLTTDATPP
jgi:hypothetical protein